MGNVHVQVRDWYVDSFKELRQFPEVRDSDTELKFTSLLKVRQQALCPGHACAVPVFLLYPTGWHVHCTSQAIHGLSGSDCCHVPLQSIYNRHRNVVPVMAMGVAELKQELSHNVGLGDLPEIHQVMKAPCSMLTRRPVWPHGGMQ